MLKDDIDNRRRPRRGTNPNRENAPHRMDRTDRCERLLDWQRVGHPGSVPSETGCNCLQRRPGCWQTSQQS